MQDQSSELSVSFCPSFNSYSCDSLADIATKVCNELQTLDLNPEGSPADDEFEFAPISVAAAEEPFPDDGAAARIGRPVFPVFNRDLISGSRGGDEEVSSPPSSSSSSEADELEGIPEGTYCVWRPKNAPPSPAASPEFRRKSNSTGSTSSKRWRFRDLLRRSNSEGKDSFVFLMPLLGGSKRMIAAGEDQKSPEVRSPAAKIRASGSSDQTVRIGSAAAGKGKNNMAAAHEMFYARNRAMNRTAEKRRSTFLPYRQDLVGIFANVNTMGRTFPPF